ncbi:hypothetical protein CGX12_01990 [Zobellella denitrificans]|uniref:DUF2987 domain-containing protein n=1 Tax=Zobellella denitrificans TaxID=347534 RepID=UPI000B8BC9D2|nr:DUF2987 domain-containing protein [Zobellella denitrificans]OXS16852.1 hypothetical protein CGX12_01990 [Zobellella denitrificans]
MKMPLIATLLALAATGVQAESLALGYSGFYKHMDTVAKARVERAGLGFYLSRQDGQGLCHVESGDVMVAGERRDRVEVLPHGQFLLPFDKQLDLDKAVVMLEVEQPERCDISIRIQAELPAGEVNAAELRQVRDEMQRLLQKMAGWPGKYFVPELKGLHLSPAEPGQRLNGEDRLELSDQQLAAERSLTLPAVRISPWL